MINIYKASAGSGKTYTLAREYIKLILGTKDEDGNYRLSRGARGLHRSVLAITFTNKATEEMKTRIIHELAVIAGLEKGWTKESPYAGELTATFGCTREELGEAAARALRDLLYDFNFFSVSTIDSFFQTILRSFAREAEVAGNYELELNDEAIIAMSVDKLLQDLNHGEKDKSTSYLINWLSSYMTQLIEDGESFNIFNRSLPIHRNLISFINRITDDTYHEHEHRLLEYLSEPRKFNEFKDRIYELIRQTCRQTSEACQAALNMINATGMKDVVNRYVYSGILKWSARGYSADGYSATLASAMEDIRKAYKKPGKNTSVPSEELDGCIAKALDSIRFAYDQVRTLLIISRNLYQMGLLSNLAEYIDRYRRENSTILLSDTNSLIAKIIGGEDAPFLYERVGVWFRHYLIDEFQDTSFSQWSNIRPLMKESLAYDHDNLVIGDEKQCIYRFRNSDPSLLHNLHTDSMAAGRCRVSGNRLSENTNWRSSAEVVRFNNTFFSALVRNLGIEEIYSNVAQQVSPKHYKRHGYVRMKAYQGAKKEDWLPEALENLTTELRRQLESGYRPGDIAILVRKRDEGNTIIRHLEDTVKADPSFPYFRIVSDASLLLGNSPDVALIVSRLRLISATDFAPDPRKKTKREVAALINGFEKWKSCGCSSDEALIKALSAQQQGEEEAKPEETATENTTAETVAEKSPTSVDLISLVEQIIKDFVPAENLRAANLYLNAFQDVVTEFVGRGQGDIRSFLRWWDEKGAYTPVAGAQDDTALNILTIHKSKGLEFPCVHIPFAELTESNKSELSWFELGEIPGIPDEIIPPMLPLDLTSAMVGTQFEEKYVLASQQKVLDRVNLLYVAFTRAVDELHIGYPAPGSRSRNMSADIVAAVETATPDFCASLDSGGDGTAEVSPFIPLAFDSDDLLVIGSPTIAGKKDEKDGTALTPSGLLDMGEYQTHTQRDIWANTCLEDRYYDIEDARDRGILLHDTMADVTGPRDIPYAINNLRHSRKARELTADDISGIHSIILRRVNDPRAAQWFSGYRKVLIERPIALGPDTTERPDRVVWTADGHIDVIDFKSGSQKPRSYVKQVNGYINLLTATGLRNVRGFLYYLDSGKIIEILPDGLKEI